MGRRQSAEQEIRVSAPGFEFSPMGSYALVLNFDEFVKSPKTPYIVIPAEPVPDYDPGAGIQSFQQPLDPGSSPG